MYLINYFLLLSTVYYSKNTDNLLPLPLTNITTNYYYCPRESTASIITITKRKHIFQSMWSSVCLLDMVSLQDRLAFCRPVWSNPLVPLWLVFQLTVWRVQPLLFFYFCFF